MAEFFEQTWGLWWLFALVIMLRWSLMCAQQLGDRDMACKDDVAGHDILQQERRPSADSETPEARRDSYRSETPDAA